MSEILSEHQRLTALVALGLILSFVAISFGVFNYYTSPKTTTTTTTTTISYGGQTCLGQSAAITQGGNYTNFCPSSASQSHLTNITYSLWQNATLMTINDQFPVLGLRNLPNATIFTIPKVVQSFDGTSYFGSCDVTLNIIKVNGTEYTSSVYSAWPMTITFHDAKCDSTSAWSYALFHDVVVWANGKWVKPGS